MADTPSDDGLEGLLEYVKQNRGFDFTGYKRSTLVRRIHKRMESVHVTGGFGAYREYLESHEPEFVGLFNTILINVTSFFRDPETWEAVSRDVIPAILADKSPTDPVRVWAPGCASGEEAFTIAILLCEALGDAAFRDRVKIYATDVDLDALATARHAVFATAALGKAMERALIERYFEPDGDRATFRKDLRRAVIFGRHDLVQDPPISRVDLLSCRNTLMYFTAPAQAQILAQFEFSLRHGGFLLLGRSEALAMRTNLFAAHDLKRRIFVPRRATAPGDPIPGSSGRTRQAADMTPSEHDLRLAGFDLGQCAHVLVDTAGILVAANQHARVLFGLTAKDVGRPLQDLELSYRPLELRSRIETVASDRRQVTVRGVEMPHGADVRTFDVVIVPTVGSGGAIEGTSVSFVEVTPQHRLQKELDESRIELETAYEELQSTVEELETTNEELQSTNEELETTNEELQSTNEELETMNEELQSTNEELETINDELRLRTEALNEANAFLAAILSSLQSAVVVVNREMRVQIWNSHAHDLWGLRSDEVDGEHVMNLDIGLPLQDLHQPLRAALAGEDDVELSVDCVNRRGRAITCRVRLSPLRGTGGEIVGAIMLMDAVERAASD